MGVPWGTSFFVTTILTFAIAYIRLSRPVTRKEYHRICNLNQIRNES